MTATKPRTVRIRHLIEVVDDSDYPEANIVTIEVTERVTLDASEEPYGPALPALEQIGREVTSKAIAQATAYEALAAAQAREAEQEKQDDPAVLGF